MRFSIDSHAEQLPRLLRLFLEIVGREPWEKRARDIVTQLTQVPVLRDILVERHQIEIEFARLLTEIQDTGRVVTKVDGQGRYELFAFIATVARVFERLSTTGQKRLRGMLRDGLRSEMGLLPLQHEMTVAVHLRSRGFNVEFQDMEGRGGSDYLARRGSVEVQVECKMVSGDIGRMLHRRAVAQQFWTIMRAVAVVRLKERGYFLRVSIPGRLQRNEEMQSGIADLVRRAVEDGSPFESNILCSVSMQTFDPAGTRFDSGNLKSLTQELARDFVKTRFGVDGGHILNWLAPGRPIVVVCLQSEQEDEMLDAILNTLKRSAKTQFSASLPAILAVQLHDLTEDALLELAGSDTTDPKMATGLQLMTSRFFNSTSGANILAVAYRAHGKFEQRVRRSINEETTTSSAGGAAYLFRNHTHPLGTDAAYNVFGIR